MTRDPMPRLQTRSPARQTGAAPGGDFRRPDPRCAGRGGHRAVLHLGVALPKAKPDDKPRAGAPAAPPASDPIALPGKAGDKPVEKPRFDFYNVLPKGPTRSPHRKSPRRPLEIVKPEKAEKADKPEAGQGR